MTRNGYKKDSVSWTICPAAYQSSHILVDVRSCTWYRQGLSPLATSLRPLGGQPLSAAVAIFRDKETTCPDVVPRLHPSYCLVAYPARTPETIPHHGGRHEIRGGFVSASRRVGQDTTQ